MTNRDKYNDDQLADVENGAIRFATFLATSYITDLKTPGIWYEKEAFIKSMNLSIFDQSYKNSAQTSEELFDIWLNQECI